MTRNNSLTAIGFVVVTSISLTLQTPAAQAAQQVCCCGATKWDGRKCWWVPSPGECPNVESGRQKWDAGIGKCIDTGSGGVGGGGDAEKRLGKKPVTKRLGKKPVMPGSSGGVGGDKSITRTKPPVDPGMWHEMTQAECEGYGRRYDPQTGACWPGHSSGQGGGGGGD